MTVSTAAAVTNKVKMQQLLDKAASTVHFHVIHTGVLDVWAIDLPSIKVCSFNTSVILFKRPMSKIDILKTSLKVRKRQLCIARRRLAQIRWIPHQAL